MRSTLGCTAVGDMPFADASMGSGCAWVTSATNHHKILDVWKDLPQKDMARVLENLSVYDLRMKLGKQAGAPHRLPKVSPFNQYALRYFFGLACDVHRQVFKYFHTRKRTVSAGFCFPDAASDVEELLHVDCRIRLELLQLLQVSVYVASATCSIRPGFPVFTKAHKAAGSPHTDQSMQTNRQSI